MTIDHRYGVWIRDGHMIWGDADKLPILLMTLVDCVVPPTSATFVHVPEVGELRQEWTGNVLY